MVNDGVVGLGASQSMCTTNETRMKVLPIDRIAVK